MEPKQLHPGAVLENGATSEGGAVFFLNMIIKGKTAPPSEVAPFSKTAPGWSRFGSTFFLSAYIKQFLKFFQIFICLRP